MLYDMMLLCDLLLHPSQSTQRIYHTYSYSFIHYNTLQYEMYPLCRQDIWIKEQSGKLGQASQQGPLEWKQIAGRQDHTVDGRIIQTLMHTATPCTPNINVIFLFGSFLRMGEINQTPRAGTALRNHNIEIRGR